MPAAATRGAPPGPAGFPLVGVFPMARRDPLGFFTECVRRHGDLVAMRLGPHRVYLLRHPDHVKHVLQDNARAYAKGPTVSRVRPLFGESLTMVDGDRWRGRRRQVQPAFHPGLLARFASVVSRAVAELLERWRPLAEHGEPAELAGEMRRLTQTIIIRACFGEVSAGELENLGQALDAAVAHVDGRLWSPLGWLDVPSPASGRHRRGLGKVEAFISRVTAEARRTEPPPGTMLAALLEATDSLAAPEVHDELKAFLFAGHTTTASALAWVWHVLSEHPEARERIEEECLAALGGREPHLEDLPSLGETRRVIEEVLRLYPPTWLTARSPVEDDSLGGYVIPAGALVLLSPYLTHRHPAVWDDPERFDPDRFIPARTAMLPAFAYFPFGGGPRRCIGSAFATTEMQMIVATVAQRYRLALLPGARGLPAAGLTLRPRSPLPARILSR
jgi:cytochrome P450